MPPLFAAFAAKALSGRAKSHFIACAFIKWVFLFSLFAWRGLFGGISRLRARPQGSALWHPAAFEKAGEAFNCASRFPIPVRSTLYILNQSPNGLLHQEAYHESEIC